MNKMMIGLIAAGVLTLSGCSMGASIEKQLSDTLIKMNDSEAEYEKNQTTLSDLEKTEQKLFGETMELTKEDVDELSKNVQELTTSTQDRLKHLESEEASMDEAKKYINQLNKTADDAGEEIKEKILELSTAATERYDLHASFTEQYRKLTSIQQEFYELLEKKDVELATLQSKADEINEQNTVVQSTIEQFNAKTKEVNNLKDALFSSLEADE